MSVISAELDQLDLREVLVSLLESFPDSIALFDADNRLLFCNSAYLADNEQMGGIVVPGVTVEEIARAGIENGVLDTGAETADEWVARRLASTQLPCAQYEQALCGGRTVLATQRRLGQYMLEIHTDISNLVDTQKALADEKLLLKSVIDSMNENIFVKDKDSRFMLVNLALCEYLGVDSPEEVMGKSDADFFNNELSVFVQNEDDKILQEGESVKDVERRYLLKTQSKPQWHSVSKIPLRNENNEIIGIVGQSKDVTQRYEFTRELSYKATHDSLTGLVNRGEFERQLKQYFAGADDHIANSVLCYLDLDRFKAVNDNAGHAAGDALLKMIAVAISEQLRRGDVVARLGGDEFAILMRDSDIDSAVRVVTRVIDSIAAISFVWQDQQFTVSASAGLTSIERNLYGINDTCAQADMACYRAKNQGRNQVCTYNTSSLAQTNE